MNRRNGLISLAAVGSLLLCAANGPATCSGHIGPTTGEVVGVGVAAAAVIIVGTVVLVKVHNSHHTIKGCVTAGPTGLEVQNEKDNRSYALTGVTSNVKVGDIIQVRGSKEKDSAGNQDFAVQRMSRDYGQCKIGPSPAPAAAGTP
jgi:hypothetical protein